MVKLRLRKLLSFFCCICFMSSFISNFAQEIVLAANDCTINVSGDNFSVSDSVYNYTTDGEKSGSMSVIYQADGSSDPTPCSPDGDGKITGIPVGSTVLFCLSPEQGFIPKLKLDSSDAALIKSPDNENLYVSSAEARNGEILVEASFVASEDANIILNLQCVVDEALQSADYDDNFKSTWATIEYSDNGGTTYKELSEGTTASGDGVYTFDSSISEVKMKITWTNEIMVILDQTTALNSGEEFTLTKGEHTALFRQAVYTLAWAYSSTEETDENLLTKNGKISVDPGEGIEGNETENGGIYVVAPDTEVTIHLIPNYGYQFEKGVIGKDVEIVPSENQSTFTFTMPKEQIIVGDIFTVHADEVNVMSDLVVSGNIYGADKIIDSGNVELTVSDSVITEDEKSKISSFASENGLESVEYLDLELNNFTLKGNSPDRWENMLTSTDSPVSVGLTLAPSLKNSDSYSVIKVHGNEISVVNTSYNSSDGMLNFETDSFSTYAIARKSDGSGGGLVGNLKTGDKNKLWLYVFIIAVAIAGFVFTFKKSRANKFRM